MGNCGSASEQNTIILVPEKRKKRARLVSMILCATTAVLIIVFYGVNRHVDEYYPDAIPKNRTNVCYRKEKKLTLAGLFTTALSLFGVVLGTLVDRVSLIFEERHHTQQRYDANRKKMIKACFSGISWGPVITLLFLTGIIFLILILVTGKPWLDLSYLVYIFSGIGVGPLIMQLLSLNTQSEVHISTIFEEKQTNVANGLAWSYYFNYLQEALTKFNETVPRNGRNAVKLQDQEERVELSSNKLILLITHDCKTNNLEDLDDNIRKLGIFANGKYKFPVYELTYNDSAYRYVIKYVKQPLETLDEMSRYGRIKILEEEQREYQVKLLYKTLFEILDKPFNPECEDKCILVGIHAHSRQCLNNGQLVEVIKKKVEAEKIFEQNVSIGIQVFSQKKIEQAKEKATTANVTQKSKNKKSDNSKVKNSDQIPLRTPDDAHSASTLGLTFTNLQQD